MGRGHLILACTFLFACDKLPSWLATEKPPAPLPTATPSASVSSAPPLPAVEWSRFSGAPDAVLDATRITLKIEGTRSLGVVIEHDGTVAMSSATGCGTRTIPAAQIGSLLAFARENSFFSLKPSYTASSPPTNQVTTRVGIRTPGGETFIVAEQGSDPPKGLLNIASAIQTVTDVSAQLAKLKPNVITQADVEKAANKDKARIGKCRALTFDIAIDRSGASTVSRVDKDGASCVTPIVTAWKFVPSCNPTAATINIGKTSLQVTLN